MIYHIKLEKSYHTIPDQKSKKLSHKTFRPDQTRLDQTIKKQKKTLRKTFRQYQKIPEKENENSYKHLDQTEKDQTRPY